MELFSQQEFENFVKTNFLLLYKGRERHLQSDRIPAHCNYCKRDVFLKLNSYYQTSRFDISNGLVDFEVVYSECPNCERRAFIICVVLKEQIESIEPFPVYNYNHYELYRLPEKEIKYETSTIPSEYTTLISSVNEALYCMNHGKLVSAAFMFRRALQIISKDVLGAKGRTLYEQLEWLKSNSNLLNIDLTELFHDNSKLIKDIGNQAAHPDDDITLHEFTNKEVDQLHDLFIIIVNEIFIKPEKIKQIQEELKNKRKIK